MQLLNLLLNENMKTKQLIEHPFKEIKDENSQILILGSFPSVVSREQNFYYMNKNNRFYKVLSKIFNEDFYNCDVEQKIKLLKKYHIALYDVVNKCFIYKSSDSSIEIVSYLNLEQIIEVTKISTIFLNGKVSYNLFIKKYPNILYPAIYLPSTSSANAKMKLEQLVDKWKIILNYLK